MNYHPGGYVPTEGVPVKIGRLECILVRRDGRWVCVRADHDHSESS
jgi:hypothetical protein